MLKGYKIRIYPTKEQEALIQKHIDGCRFIWNYMLEKQKEKHDNNERYLSRFDMIKLLPSIKCTDEYSWLSDVSNASLQRTCTNLSAAYNMLFNHTNRFPKFKSRKTAKQKYPIRSESSWFSQDKVHIEKIGKVKYKTDYQIPVNKRNLIKNASISLENGKYYICFVMEYENQRLQLTDVPMGIDLGIKELAVVAFGEEKFVYHNINKSAKMKRLEEQIIYHQKIASRKRNNNKSNVKSNNLKKEEAIIKKLSERKANIRKDYIHKITNELTSMLPCCITVETLSFDDMLGLSSTHNKNVSEQNLYEFVRQLEYKCERKGIPFIKADKYYPSSKICSCCGSVKSILSLSERKYKCECCGFQIDRDYNAAINLMKYGIQQKQIPT